MDLRRAMTSDGPPERLALLPGVRRNRQDDRVSGVDRKRVDQSKAIYRQIARAGSGIRPQPPEHR